MLGGNYNIVEYANATKLQRTPSYPPSLPSHEISYLLHKEFLQARALSVTMPKPGVVFRVPATRPCQPCSRASAIAAWAAVATPEARDRMLSAVRSARSNLRVGPTTFTGRIW